MAVTESKGDGYALYGGVKLPNIETVWTDEVKETYPYATSGILEGYSILFLTGVGLGYNTEYSLVGNFETTKALIYVYWEGAWALDAELEDCEEGNLSLNDCIWASYDILNATDSTVYLSASDPIPLDGMNVIEWDGDTTGLVSIDDDVAYRVADFVPVSSVVGVMSIAGILEVFDEFKTVESSSWLAGPVGSEVVVGISDADSEAIGDESGIYFANVDDIYVPLFAYTPTTTDDGETEEPAVVEKFPLRAFIMGILSELTAGSTKEPIAYLYNGVQLPALPEWDRESYPYAHIQRYSATSPLIYLILTKEPLGVVAATDLLGNPTIDIPVIDNLVIQYTGLYDKWKDESGWETNVTTLEIGVPKWSNHDILYDDGTLYLAASEPVPVYE